MSPPESHLQQFQQRIGHVFRNPRDLLRALTHKSHAHEARGGDGSDNETLEFLGDSVLGFVVGECLFRRFPGMDEGALSKMKAYLVSAPTLAKKAREYGIGEVIQLGVGEERSGGRNKDSLLADAFEALIAAIYLDGGLEPARELIMRTFSEDVENLDTNDLRFQDYKTALQEVAQSRALPLPSYRVLEERGPDHSKTFVVEVTVGDIATVGEGPSKKEAQQRAAREALRLSAGDEGGERAIAR